MAHPGPGNFSFCDLFCNFCDSPEFVDNILRIHKWQGDVNWTKMEKGKSSSSIFLFSFFNLDKYYYDITTKWPTEKTKQNLDKFQ